LLSIPTLFSPSYQNPMNMDALIEHVKTAAAQADEADRKKIMDELRDLSISIETGYDSMQRIMYSV
jgi:hypothetical protein